MKTWGIFVLGLSLFVTSQAMAHSDYWRCAVGAGGSVENVAAQCGMRSDFDRTGRLGGAAGSDPNYQRQMDEQDRRERERERRDYEERQERERREWERNEYDRRREREDEERRRSSYTPAPSYPSYPSTPYNPPAYNPPAYQEDASGDVTIAVDQVVTNGSINIGVLAGLREYHGYKVTAIKVDAEINTPTKVKVLVKGSQIGQIYGIESGYYEKTFKVKSKIDRNASNLVLNVSGTAKIVQVILTLQK